MEIDNNDEDNEGVREINGARVSDHQKHCSMTQLDILCTHDTFVNSYFTSSFEK